MEVEQARWFTIHRIILGDALLNWFLGAVLLVLPEGVDRLIAETHMMSLVLYRIIGACFVIFAAWQTWIISQGQIRPAGLIAAALLALFPLVMVASALLFMDLPLRPAWRLILWVGNFYMLFLAAWYLMLARMLARTSLSALEQVLPS